MFHPLNLIAIAGYLFIIAVIGLVAGRNEKNTDDYFLGGRKIPWLAVCLSILATECSAVTFIGAPAISFAAGGNYTYIQLAIGSLIGRILIAYLLLIPFYKYKVTTVYEFLRIRFSRGSQITGAIFFFITRLLASGVRLFVASLAIHVVFGVPLFAAIVLSAGIASAYTLWGGIKAVIWTDVVQIIIFMGGATFTVYLLYVYSGGFETIRQVAGSAGKFSVFDMSFDITQPFTLLTGIIGGCFLTFASLGTDQDLTQRMLTCRDTKLAQKALIWTGIIDFPVVFVFLTIGVLLYVFYTVYPDPSLPANKDHLFPYFILTQLPPGLSGLLIVGVFAAAMSSLDSALNALASSAICDIYKPYISTGREESHYLMVSRVMVVFFAVALVGIAYMCKNLGMVLVLAFKITSFTYGALMGVFLIGVLTKRGSTFGNLIAMCSSIPVVFMVTLTSIAWPYYIVAGTLWTFAVGTMFSPSMTLRRFSTAMKNFNFLQDTSDDLIHSDK